MNPEHRKSMVFRKKHTHPTKKGYSEAGCPACEAIAKGNSTTGESYGRGAPWRPRNTSRG